MTFAQVIATQLSAFGQSIARECARWCMALCAVVGHKPALAEYNCLRCVQALRSCEWCNHDTPVNHACERCGEDRPAW